jgi:hypothetical protein
MVSSAGATTADASVATPWPACVITTPSAGLTHVGGADDDDDSGERDAAGAAGHAGTGAALLTADSVAALAAPAAGASSPFAMVVPPLGAVFDVLRSVDALLCAASASAGAPAFGAPAATRAPLLGDMARGPTVATALASPAEPQWAAVAGNVAILACLQLLAGVRCWPVAATNSGASGGSDGGGGCPLAEVQAALHAMARGAWPMSLRATTIAAGLANAAAMLTASRAPTSRVSGVASLLSPGGAGSGGMEHAAVLLPVLAGIAAAMATA